MTVHCLLMTTTRLPITRSDIARRDNAARRIALLEGKAWRTSTDEQALRNARRVRAEFA